MFSGCRWGIQMHDNVITRFPASESTLKRLQHIRLKIPSFVNWIKRLLISMWNTMHITCTCSRWLRKVVIGVIVRWQWRRSQQGLGSVPMKLYRIINWKRLRVRECVVDQLLKFPVRIRTHMLHIGKLWWSELCFLWGRRLINVDYLEGKLIFSVWFIFKYTDTPIDVECRKIKLPRHMSKAWFQWINWD